MKKDDYITFFLYEVRALYEAKFQLQGKKGQELINRKIDEYEGYLAEGNWEKIRSINEELKKKKLGKVNNE